MIEAERFVARALARCRRVSAGARELHPLLSPHLPFGGTDLDVLDLAARTAAVAFIKRFEQLQDLLTRLARAIVNFEGDDGAAMTQRDLGNWLEKRALLDDVERWMVVARLRNRLVHEYPIEEAEQVLRLNESWALAPLLYHLTDQLGSFAEHKGIVA